MHLRKGIGDDFMSLAVHGKEQSRYPFKQVSGFGLA